MRPQLLKSRIHQGTCTSVDLDYVIAGPRGSGMVRLNSAAARLALPGDLAIITSFAAYDEPEAQEHQPRVVLVNAQNHLVRPQLRAES